MKKTESINYRGKSYPVRRINLEGFGERNISTLELDTALTDVHGNLVDDEAAAVDERIFFFVTEEELGYDEKDLADLVLENIV